MRYGKLYQTANVSKDLINKTLSYVDMNKLKEGEIMDGSPDKTKKSSGRSSNVTFITDKIIQKRWLNITNKVSKDLGWDFHLNTIEPIQYGEYNKNQEYSWHVDQHSEPYNNNLIRKISFSVFLNDDYTGGEFDLEIYPPGSLPRYKTFSNLPLNTILFFQSEFWHRVRPVTKGVRKSLVGWVLGPKFI